MQNQLIVVVGPSASGKTTFVNKLKRRLDCIILSLDNYYKKQDNLSFKDRENVNYDNPNQIDFDLLYKHLIQLLNDKEIEEPIYNFALHNRDNGVINIKPRKYIVLEGIFCLCDPRIAALSKYNVLIKCDDNICLERRLTRDIADRGRTREYALKQYYKYTKPALEKYVKRSLQNINKTIDTTNGILDQDILSLAEEIKKNTNS